MKMKRRTIVVFFLIILLAFCVSAASVMLVPFAIGEDGNMNFVGYVAGGLFWLGMITGFVGYFTLWMKIRKQVRNGLKKSRIPAILCFFSNPFAIAMDVILIVGIVGTIYCVQSNTQNVMLAMICLLLMILGVYTHFLFNGKVYQYIRNSDVKVSGADE